MVAAKFAGHRRGADQIPGYRWLRWFDLPSFDGFICSEKVRMYSRATFVVLNTVNVALVLYLLQPFASMVIGYVAGLS